MESLDYWRLCDELTIIQAALLTVGEDPSVDQEYVERWAPERRPKGYSAVMAALTHAIYSGRLPAQVQIDNEKHRTLELFTTVGAELADGNVVTIEDLRVHRPLDIALSTIAVDDLKKWLRARGIKTGFFFPEVVMDGPDYLDGSHPNYAPKLAAAVEAWQTVTSTPDLLRNKTPKQALEKWLREHGARYGLTDDEGKLNEQGMADVAKVANWNTKGGAPKTFSSSASKQNPPTDQ